MASTRLRREKTFALVLLAPALLCTGTGIFVPIVRSVGLSLFNVRLAAGGTTTSWAGLGNFAAVIRNGSLVRALRVTVIFAGSVVVGMFVVGLALALLLNVRIKGQRVLRSLALLPWVTPTIITALLWSWIFQPQYGLANYLLSSLGLISRPIAWTADLTWALPAVMIAALWRDLPFMFLMLLAGLQAIPTEMYEAARIDGAGPVVSFTRITLPFLRNVIKTTVLLAIINNFKQFPLFWTMTGGGPVDRTTTLAVLTYKEAFVDLSFGRAAAVSTAWLGLLVVFSLAYTRLFRGMERE